MAKNDKMKDFKIDYDADNDSLFVYLEGSKSKGAVEIGNFVLDFDENNDLVAMEIFDAKEIFKILLTKIIELNNLKEFKADIVSMRNMAGIKFKISDGNTTETSSFLIPRKLERSPALDY